MFAVYYVLFYVLMKSSCKLLQDGDNAETCVIERIHRTINFAFVGVTKVLRGMRFF
jgi:hypothetical protein